MLKIKTIIIKTTQTILTKRLEVRPKKESQKLCDQTICLALQSSKQKPNGSPFPAISCPHEEMLEETV